MIAGILFFMHDGQNCNVWCILVIVVLGDAEWSEKSFMMNGSHRSFLFDAGQLSIVLLCIMFMILCMIVR